MSQIYSKDSFDRFGDDLMEVLLNYLSIEQNFKYESVSNQWQRLVFNKQNHLTIVDQLIMTLCLVIGIGYNYDFEKYR